MTMPYSYAVKTSSLKKFLQKVKNKELGVPKKITQRYLESIGYKTKNDRRIISVFKSIDFLDDTGKPTQRFRDFRTEKARQVMTEALRQTYSELFQTYPEPYKRTRKELEDFFAKDTDLKKGTLGLMADTFNLLCEFADFEGIPIKGAEIKEPEKKAVEVARLTTQTPAGVTINLNIQLTLPATEDATVYDKIFKALKENLLS